MSATAVLTMAQPTTLQMSTTSCCPKCGFSVDEIPPTGGPQPALLEAQKQIEDLQAQVRLLNQKAAAAVDRWADYEDELSRLRRQVASENTPSPPPPLPGAFPASPPRSSFLSGNRISALLSPRSAKSMSNLKAAPLPTPPPSTSSFSPISTAAAAAAANPTAAAGLPPTPRTPSTDDLLSALSREQSLRQAAEGRLTDTSREVEELSAQLFEQANEMVATERRARARLEERVELLERRDADKRRRLERLEHAMLRIERLRALLGDAAPAPAPASRAGERDAGAVDVAA